MLRLRNVTNPTRFIKTPLLTFGVASAVLSGVMTMLAACSKPAREVPPIAAEPETVITALIWAPDWPNAMQRTAEAFHLAHPHLRVNLQFMIGDSVEENLKPRVAANHLPDLISVNPNQYAAGLAEQGILIDLADSPAWNNMIERLKPDWTAAGNQHFGVPGGVAATLMYYNTDMFRRAGIKTPPRNFDEFLRVCERLKKSGMTPLMWYGGFPNMLGNGPFSAGFANNFVAREPDWKRRIADGSFDFDVPAGADIFGKMRLLAERGYVQDDYLTTGYEAGIKLFTEGKVAMAFHGTWAAGRLMHGDRFVTNVFGPPWNAAGKTAVPVLGSETGFAVTATPNRVAALQFLEFMMGPGFSIQQNSRQNIPPMKNPVGNMVEDPLIAAYIRDISGAPVTASPYYSFLPAATIELSHTLMQEVLFHKVSPRQAANMLNQSIKNEAMIKNR